MGASAQRKSLGRNVRITSAIGLGTVAGVLAIVLTTGAASVHNPVEGIVGYGVSTPGHPRVAPGLPARSRKKGHRSFTISGSVSGLYPGATRSLVLTVTSHEPYAIVVTRLTTVVMDTSSTCRSANLTVSSFVGTLSVAPRSAAVTRVVVRMASDAGDNCAGADFPLVFRGVAKRAAP
jgi:hypothetical protein